MVSSTLLTLIGLPVVYSYLDGVRQYLRRCLGAGNQPHAAVQAGLGHTDRKDG